MVVEVFTNTASYEFRRCATERCVKKRTLREEVCDVKCGCIKIHITAGIIQRYCLKNKIHTMCLKSFAFNYKSIIYNNIY